MTRFKVVDNHLIDNGRQLHVLLAEDGAVYLGEMAPLMYRNLGDELEVERRAGGTHAWRKAGFLRVEKWKGRATGIQVKALFAMPVVGLHGRVLEPAPFTRKKSTLMINQLIQQLQAAKMASPKKGDTPVYVQIEGKQTELPICKVSTATRDGKTVLILETEDDK
jgi:hypothetical protein